MAETTLTPEQQATQAIMHAALASLVEYIEAEKGPLKLGTFIFGIMDNARFALRHTAADAALAADLLAASVRDYNAKKALAEELDGECDGVTLSSLEATAGLTHTNRVWATERYVVAVQGE